MKSGGGAGVAPSKPREMMKFIIVAVAGGQFGVFLSMFFMECGVSSDIGTPSIQSQGPQYVNYRPTTPKVRERCRYEWDVYTKRWNAADARQAELDSAEKLDNPTRAEVDTGEGS